MTPSPSSASSRFSAHRLLAAAALLLAGLLSAGAAAATDERIPAFEAEYVVKYGRMTIGEGTLSLSYPEDGRYRYRLYVTPRGLARLLVGIDLTEVSAGRIEAGGALAPERYVHRREGRSERHEALRFERRQGDDGDEDQLRVHLPGGKEKAVAADTVDRLLPQLLMMRDLEASGRKAFTYRVVDEDGELSDYTLRRQGREHISVAAGDFRAERIQRIRGQGSSRETRAWVDPRRHNLPLRIEHTTDGRTFVMELEAVHGPITE